MQVLTSFIISYEIANFALDYVNNASSKDYINLYDVSGLAHYELLKIMKSNPLAALPVSEQELLNDMGALLSQGLSQVHKFYN